MPNSFVFVGTLQPSGKLILDDAASFRQWARVAGGMVRSGTSGDKFVITIEEQFSAEARKFYFRILQWLRQGEMEGWTCKAQEKFFKDEFNDGRSITELSHDQFDQFLDSVVEWSAQHGLVVPEPNKRHRIDGDGL